MHERCRFRRIPAAVRNVETVLARLFAYSKISYLMPMTADPLVHYRVLSHFAETCNFAAAAFTAPGWPGQPRLDHATPLDGALSARLLEHIGAAWPS